MKNKYLALCLCFASVLSAQEIQKPEQLDSVFIDTKITIPRKNSGKIVAKITRQALEQNQGKPLSQFINEISGIEINGSRSNDGQNLGYFVRGGRNRQVVIMIDGVQLSDASQIANDYDLRLVPTSSVESVEIIKGASSVLYGSGAATAVISITTLKESKKPISATFTSALGTNRSAESGDNYSLDEFTNSVSVNGTLNKFFYKADFGNRFVDGLSAIAAPENEPAFESDIFNKYNGRLNLGYHFNKDLKFSQFFSFDTFKAGFDDFSFTDAANFSISKQLRTGGNFEWKYSKGIYVFNDSFTWIDRDITSSFPAKYDAKTYNLDNYVTYNFSERFMALLGLQYSTSQFNSFTIPFGSTDFEQDVSGDIANFDIIDPYLNLTYFSGFGLNVNAGIRVNNHSNYGSHFVYNVNPSYVFTFGETNLKVLTSYSTAYITPSLFQLYDPLYGNENLQPEENRTIEAGLEFITSNKLIISAVYFNRKEDNFVDFLTIDPNLFIFQYGNIDESFEVNGVEVELSKQFGKHFNFSANYTNTQTDERFSLRIPEHKANASIGYSFSKLFLGANYQFNSERTDTFFNQDTFESESIALQSFGVLDANVTYQATKVVKVFASINNMLNEEYEELYRFQTRGRNVRAGFSLNF